MKLSGIDRVGKKPADPEAVFQDTPEKFQSAALELAAGLVFLIQREAAFYGLSELRKAYGNRLDDAGQIFLPGMGACPLSVPVSQKEPHKTASCGTNSRL